ncbi:MAG: glutaredoxin family protein [Chlorobiales bacterium]|nr:glutaredoxin family protein [Chlorobiales bacterium]
MTITRHRVILYGKVECCLCDEAMEVLQKVNAVVPFDLEKIDISDNPELLARFGLKIPVVFVDGVQVFKYRVHEKRLLGFFKKVLSTEKESAEE